MYTSIIRKNYTKCNLTKTKWIKYSSLQREKHQRLGRKIASRSLRGGQVLWYTVTIGGREIQGYCFECYKRFVYFNLWLEVYDNTLTLVW